MIEDGIGYITDRIWKKFKEYLLVCGVLIIIFLVTILVFNIYEMLNEECYHPFSA